MNSFKYAFWIMNMEVFDMSMKKGTVSYKEWVNMTYNLSQESLSPFHYKEAYERVMNEKHGEEWKKILPPNFQVDKQNGTRHVENFRNMLCEDARFEHIGNGRGMFTLKEWLNPDQRKLFRDKPERVECTLEDEAESYRETGNRAKHMLNKYDDSPQLRCKKILNGMKAEIYVKKRFKEKYPNQFIKPENEGIYDKYDRWDFGIANPIIRMITFDIKSCWKLDDGRDVICVEKNRIDRNWSDIFIGTTQNGDVALMGFVSKCERDNAIKTKRFYMFPRELWHDIKYLYIYLNHLMRSFNFPQILENGYTWRDKSV